MARLSTLHGLALSAVIIASVAFVLPRATAQPVLVTKAGNISLIVSNTPALEERGLGYRASLPKNEGMLFEFGKPQSVCLWMKSMHFSLDMLWFNADKKVIYLEQNISPKTYPKVYCAPGNTDYVIEVNSGVAASDGIKVGQTLQF